MLSSSIISESIGASLPLVLQQELEALLAIYGTESISVDWDARIVTYKFAFNHSPPLKNQTDPTESGSNVSKSDSNQILSRSSHRNFISPAFIKFHLPRDYPETLKGPKIEISPALVDSIVIRDIENTVNSLFQPGSVVLFQYIECIREKLDSWHLKKAAVPQEKVYATLDTFSADSLIESRKQTHFSVNDNLIQPSITIHCGDEILDRKSVFQAHAAEVHTLKEVKTIQTYLLNIPKIAKATHNILAYRLSSVPKARKASSTPSSSTVFSYNRFQKEKLISFDNILQDYDSDGETAAGGRLQHLLITLKLVNVMVMVSRWYGGKKLGPDRFRHINNSARNALEKGGFLDVTKNITAKERKKFGVSEGTTFTKKKN